MQYKKEFKRWLTPIQVEDKVLYDVVCKYFEEIVPEYFWEVAASSTGKYHPKLSLGKGGLLRHTKMALLVAEELLNLTCYKHIDREHAFVAIMLHDTIKHGDKGSKYTTKDHADVAANGLQVVIDSMEDNIKGKVVYDDIIDAMRGHMGQWDKNYDLHSRTVKYSELVKFVHLCDYLASRKFFDLTLEELDGM